MAVSRPDGLEAGATVKIFSNRQSATGSRQSIPRAFTLIELLVVISIMGLIAGLGVPALKNLGKSNAQTNAQRQLLDDLGRARQLAISQHTTVYMVFVPTNYFELQDITANGSIGNILQNDLSGGINWTISPAPAEKQQAMLTLTNLVESQLAGYNFIAKGRVGDQPGQHAWHYLGSWQTLPQGMMIASAKFLPQNYSTPMSVPAWVADYPNAGQIDTWLPSGTGMKQQIYGFTNSAFPFPTEKAPMVRLPYLAFDSTGRLVSETADGVTFHHAYIPLAQGSVAYGYDANKRPVLSPVPANGVTEVLPGNSTSISYNIIDVDPLSGRAKLQVHHIPQ